MTHGRTPTSLEAALERLDVAVRRADPEGHSSLGRPVAPDSLRALAAEIGMPLPPDLESLFRWHDGSGKRLVSFDGSSVYSMMSCADVLAARRFLLGPESDGAGYPPDWLPVFTKGNGDYVSYVLAGAEAGHLIEYRHDDARRPLWRASLLELAAEAVATWERMPARAAAELTRVGEWSRQDRVDVSALRVGAAVAICSLSPGMQLFWDLYVQVEAGQWVWGFSGAPDWEPEALATAARAMGARRHDTGTIATNVELKLEEVAWTLQDPPSRAPRDLGSLGLYLGRVVRGG